MGSKDCGKTACRHTMRKAARLKGMKQLNMPLTGGTEGIMLQLEYDKQQIEEMIDKIVRKTMNMDLTWDWPCGVAYYGICRNQRSL